MNADFNWLNDPDVIVPEQQAIAVYRTERGDIYIRQERDWCEEQDQIVAIQPRREAIAALIYKLIDEADLPFELIERHEAGGYSDVERPEPVSAVATRDTGGNASENGARDATEPDQLTLADRRELARAALIKDPERSNRSIASDCDLSDKTVAAIRAELAAESAEPGAEERIESAEFRTGTDEEQLPLRDAAE